MFVTYTRIFIPFLSLCWPVDRFCTFVLADFLPRDLRVNRRWQARYNNSANGLWVVNVSRCGVRGSGRALDFSFLRLRRLSAEFFEGENKNYGSSWNTHLGIATAPSTSYYPTQIPSFDIVPKRTLCVFLDSERDIYRRLRRPVPCSRTTKADLTGACQRIMFANQSRSLCMERLDTKSVDLFIFQTIKSQKTRGI